MRFWAQIRRDMKGTIFTSRWHPDKDGHPKRRPDLTVNLFWEPRHDLTLRTISFGDGGGHGAPKPICSFVFVMIAPPPDPKQNLPGVHQFKIDTQSIPRSYISGSQKTARPSKKNLPGLNQFKIDTQSIPGSYTRGAQKTTRPSRGPARRREKIR